jgi:N-acyl-D-aspartate/D-glutamate deacylase
MPPPDKFSPQWTLNRLNDILTLMRRSIVILLLAAFLFVGCQTRYDLVIQNGRVIDPESGLDGVRSIGITGTKIAAVREGSLVGKRVLDAAGHVVAPGFIDLHQHGQTPENYAAHARDGITTSLELEIGVENIDAWYAERAGGQIVNYGASISHPYSRQVAMTGSNPGLQGEALARPATPDQVRGTSQLIAKGLDQGAVAVGFGVAYSPGATKEELIEMFKVAAPYGASCHVHMRTTPDDFSNIEELLEASKKSGAPLHVVHLNSSGGERAGRYLEIITQAQKDGIDVTTECYPYNRGSTLIQSHPFDNWETFPEDRFQNFIWVETGETLTRESFARFRQTGGTIISPPTYSMETVKMLVASPLTMIASDGMWLVNGRAHPRSFGTYSRVLGHYVREEKALSLTDALAKMTIRPAKRLERRVPMMQNKGRIKAGADADIVVFNPGTIIDRGTYQDPVQAPEGIKYVLVNGAVALNDGKLVEGVRAGTEVRAPKRTSR